MKILSFDIESCTGNPLDGSLCSFGYCMAEDFEIITKEDILVNPKPKKFRLGKYGEEAKIKLAYSEEEFRRAPVFPMFMSGSPICSRTFSVSVSPSGTTCGI